MTFGNVQVRPRARNTSHGELRYGFECVIAASGYRGHSRPTMERVRPGLEHVRPTVSSPNAKKQVWHCLTASLREVRLRTSVKGIGATPASLPNVYLTTFACKSLAAKLPTSRGARKRQVGDSGACPTSLPESPPGLLFGYQLHVGPRCPEIHVKSLRDVGDETDLPARRLPHNWGR